MRGEEKKKKGIDDDDVWIVCVALNRLSLYGKKYLLGCLVIV